MGQVQVLNVTLTSISLLMIDTHYLPLVTAGPHNIHLIQDSSSRTCRDKCWVYRSLHSNSGRMSTCAYEKDLLACIVSSCAMNSLLCLNMVSQDTLTISCLKAVLSLYNTGNTQMVILEVHVMSVCSILSVVCIK